MIHFMTGFVIIANAGVNIIALIVTIMISIIASIIKNTSVIKIFIFLGLMFVMLSSTYAQKGRQAIGFGLSYGTEIESAGLGIKYQYNITNPLRIEPSFNYFFENDNVSMLDLNVNFHYLCPVAQSVKLYPLVWSDHVQLDV